MNISVSSGDINKNVFAVNKRKILIAGPALSTYKSREIISPGSKDEAFGLYGNSPLYEAYCLLVDLGVNNIYLSNCYSNSDYIRLADKIIQYDFDYFVPIGIYFGDTFYNPIEDKDQYFIEYMLQQLSIVNSLTTIIMTERHASLYEDFDHFVISMSNIEKNFMESFNYDSSEFLDAYGNNLLFIYNNLRNIPFANVILAGLLHIRDYAKYLPALTMNEAIYDINNIDMMGLRAMYFKNNFYTNNVTVENTLNFKKTQDIYSNALIDDVIKKSIKSIDLESYKGKLYNQYTALQIESSVTNSLKSMKGLLFKEYTINKVGFKKTDPTAGCIVIDFSFVPYGTLESVNIIMGV